MNIQTLTLSALATLAAVIAPATASAASTCDLPVIGEDHVLRVLESDDFVTAIANGSGVLEGRTGATGERIEIVPGLGDPSTVSLRSIDNPNHYFVVNMTTGNMELLPYQCTADFFQRARFDMTAGTSTGLCNYSGVSFRWDYPGVNYYLTGHAGLLSVEPEIISHANGYTDETQTFAIDWEEDSAPICE